MIAPRWHMLASETAAVASQTDQVWAFSSTSPATNGLDRRASRPAYGGRRSGR